MDTKERLIRDTKKANRGLDFAGLNKIPGKKDSVYCSDIDAILEFDDKHLIIIEIKEEGKRLPLGQNLLLSRLAKRWGEFAIVIFATHDPNIEGDVLLDECQVQEIYHVNIGWAKRDASNLLNYLHKLGDKWDINKLKKR